MAQAIWNGTVLADSDDVVVVEGRTYFPKDAVDPAYLKESSNTSVCAWKGTANYYTVVVDGEENTDAAWYYATPSEAAKEITDRIAFWRGVEVVTGPSGGDAGAAGAKPGLMDRLRTKLSGTKPAGDRTHDHDHHEHDHAQHDHDSPVVDLDDASFEDGTEGHWTVVDFWAPWCGPCRAFHPVFDEVASQTDGVTFARVNVDESPKSASTLGILSIPTVVLFDTKGNEVDRIVGVPPRKDFDALIARADTATASAN